MASAASAAGAIAAAAAGAAQPRTSTRTSTRSVKKDVIDKKDINLTHDALMYLKSRNVLLQILEMRGYDVSPITTESPEEINNIMNNLEQHYMSVYEEDDKKRSGRKCRVFLSKTYGAGIKEIKKHIDEDYPDRINVEIDEIILIVFGALSPTSLKAVMRESRVLSVHIDAIQVENLLFNPFNHVLVPEYEPISIGSEEEAEIMKSVIVKKKKQFPVILRSDIIARLLGLHKEQLVIVKNKGPGGTNKFIRVCLEA